VLRATATLNSRSGVVFEDPIWSANIFFPIGEGTEILDPAICDLKPFPHLSGKEDQRQSLWSSF